MVSRCKLHLIYYKCLVRKCKNKYFYKKKYILIIENIPRNIKIIINDII